MRTTLKLSLFWIICFLHISQVNGQITFINPPADTIVSCSGFISFPDDPDLEDPCSGNNFVFFSDSTTRVNSTDTCAFYEYIVFRTFSAMNSCADTSKYVQTITVIDTTAPVFTPPPAVTIDCSDLNNLDIAGNIPPFADECGGPVTRTYRDEVLPIRCDSTITRTWTVTDACGNFSTATQLITVVDNLAPEFLSAPRDISVMCSMTENPYNVFNDWVENLGYSVFEDQCNPVVVQFAAVPGSYDLTDPSTFPGEFPGVLNPPECGIVEGAVQFEEVDFIIVDPCGNATVEAATFYYVDDVFPSIGDCGFTMTVDLLGSECFTTLKFNVPEASDSCSSENLNIKIEDVQEVLSTNPGQTDVLVSDLNFRLGPFGPEFEISEENFFSVDFVNVDAEGAGETFVIIDENNNPIGITPNAAAECDSFSFTFGPFSEALVASWVEDKFVEFRFTPSVNSNPEEAVNDVCSAAKIRVYKEFTIESQADSVEILFSLDEDPFALVELDSIDVDLFAGIHSLKFMARDCAGNRTTCVQNITVNDAVRPQLNCAVSKQVDTAPGICGFPSLISEIAIINNPCEEDLSIDVEIDGAMNVLVSGKVSDLQDSMIVFPVGASTIRVVVNDFSSNQSECFFNLEVNDNEFPVAICEPSEISTVAVALEQFVVDPFLLAGASTDNCGIASIIIDDNNFTCGDIGTTFTKTILVTDNSNNTSTCNSTFTITEADVPVTYTVGICPEDRLQFFLNIPIRDEYVYDWDGPFGFSSVLAEPFIPNVGVVHEGTYFLTIRNVMTGCESTAEIEVFVDDVKSPTLVAERIGCEVIPHRFSTNKVEGENITYDWYRFIDGVRSLIVSTDSAFVELLYPPGNFTFGVVISNEICESQSSNRVEVEIRGKPDGAICSNLLIGCTGQPLELCVDDPEDQFIIRWFGPNGFVSDEAMPVVTDSFTSDFSGIYKLVIEDRMCITDTLTTSVIPNETPPTPQIIGSNLYCSGDSLVLQSSEAGPDYVYVWNSPSGVLRTNVPTLAIPAADTKFNGEWTLSLENGPCRSGESSSFLVDVEAVFSFEILTNQTQCVGSQVTFTTTGQPESMFRWEGPDGFTSSEFNPTVNVVDGTYAVEITTRNGCIYRDQIEMNTITVPSILGVDVSVEGQCIDPNTDLLIIPVLNQSADVFYEWTGPNVEIASSSLTIENFSFEDNGIYSVKVLNGGCESEVFTFVVSLIVSPIQPTLNTAPIACIGDSLFLTTNQYGSSALYQWITPGGTVETADNRLGLGNVTPDLSGNYGVQVMIGECTSPVSELVDITVNENTFVPTIITEGEICLQSDLKIYADLSSELDMEWELADGSVIITDTLTLTLEESDSGTYRVRSLSNGCPSEWSSPFIIDVADPRLGVSFESDFLFSCNNQDSGLEFCIDDNGGLSGEQYKWYLGDLLLGETTSRCFQVEDASVFAFGLNEISLRIVYNGCEVVFEEPLLLEIENVLDINFSAGEDQLFCVGDGLIMNADEVSSAKLSAFWSVDVGAEVDDISDPMATITVLEDLDSLYAIWNIEHIECGIVFRDSIVLRQKVKPIPITDTLEMDNDAITFNPLENDILIDGNNYEITEVSRPRWGEARVSGDAIVYQADPKFIGGPITFSYTVCDNACEILCSEGEVILLYNAESCKGNNVLTPNNDGANDRFVIPCIEHENLPESNIVILNELGNTVYEQSPYDNSWDGTFNGEPLAEGTYYYIFRKDDNASVVQGFISIER